MNDESAEDLLSKLERQRVELFNQIRLAQRRIGQALGRDKLQLASQWQALLESLERTYEGMTQVRE